MEYHDIDTHCADHPARNYDAPWAGMTNTDRLLMMPGRVISSVYHTDYRIHLVDTGHGLELRYATADTLAVSDPIVDVWQAHTVYDKLIDHLRETYR